MSDWKESIVKKGMQVGMDTIKKMITHPSLGPMLLRSLNNLLDLRKSLEDSREKLLERLKIASFEEQSELRRNMDSMTKKIERLERRIKEMQKKLREAERAKQQAEREAKAALAAKESGEE